MKIFVLIVALQIIGVYSISKISLQGDNRALKIAASDIVNKCFGSSERWSELLIIAEYASDEIIGEINRNSKTSNLIVSLDTILKREYKPSEKYSNYSNTQIEWQNIESKTTGVIMTVYSLKQLDSVLSFLKNNINGIWKPESSYFFIVVVGRECDIAEYNNMFKVIWGYWILNAVIICSTNYTNNLNQSGIELYTFNPYSGDHSQKWETIVEEIIEVKIITGKFNHSWYIFKKIFNGIRSFDHDDDDIFFDKTSNLDGYLIPIGFGYSGFLSNKLDNQSAKFFEADCRVLKSISTKLRFEVTEVVNHDPNLYGLLHANGSYSGMLADIHTGRSHLGPTMRVMRIYPGLGMTYPHRTINFCFISKIIGIRPRWTNLIFAKYIWIGIGFGIITFTIVFYLQNKSHGITSAFLEALRMIIGTSIIHTSKVSKNRIILGSILLVVLVIDGTIRGRFISILTVARPYPNLDTVEQLREQKVDLYGHPVMRHMFMDPQLKSRFNDNVSFTECFDSLNREESQRACFLDCQALNYMEWNSSIIHISKNPFRENYAVFLTTIHWPMKNRYSFEIQKLVEAGIYEKWKLDVGRKVEIDSWKLKRLSESANVISIKLNDLLTAFVLLFVGLSIALIVFACEIKGPKSFSSVKF